jgi:hypothetical protein
LAAAGITVIAAGADGGYKLIAIFAPPVRVLLASAAFPFFSLLQ